MGGNNYTPIDYSLNSGKTYYKIDSIYYISNGLIKFVIYTLNMKFSKGGGERELLQRDKADRELEIELSRIKMIRKMGGHKGRMIVQ